MAYPLDQGNKPGDGPLRLGGVSVSDINQPESNLPSTLSKAAERQRPALQLVRDLWDGAEKVHDQGSKYLPQSPGERAADYRVRLDRAVFHEFFGDTVEGLTGMVFRKDPVLGEDVPDVIQQHWENIDNAGTHGDVFCRDVFQDALATGHNAVLVEYPRTGGTQTAADETIAPLPIRPYWVPIKKDDILSWRTTVENGVTVLAQIVLRECVMVPDGLFGEKEQTRYRVLYRESGVVGFKLLEVTKEKAVVLVEEGLYPTQDEIPIAEIRTAGRKSLFESKPPLYGLGVLNLAHYRQWSDHDTSLHKTCVPIFARIGFEPPMDSQGNPMVLGPNDGLDLPTGGDAKYVSHDGASLASVKQSLDDLVAHIATLGMSMLASQKRAAETATAKRIDKTATDSALGVTARGAQDGFERCLGFHAKYLKQETGGSIALNRDFENLELSPEAINALSALVEKGQLTLKTLWKKLSAGNVLPDGFDDEQEESDLNAEAELKRVDAEQALELARAQTQSNQPISQAA